MFLGLSSWLMLMLMLIVVVVEDLIANLLGGGKAFIVRITLICNCVQRIDLNLRYHFVVLI